MTEAEVLIKNQLGLHVRACSKFVRTASRFKNTEVLVSHDGLEVNGKSIMGVMMLAAEMGSTIKIRAQGPEESEAVAALKELVDGKFEGEP
jgi:phosphocarrier protein